MASSRRVFVGAALGGLAGALGARGRADADPRPADASLAYGQPSPTEALMRGHAVVERLLAIYDAAAALVQSGAVVPPGTLRAAAWLVHEYMDLFHDRAEERWLFPRFERAACHVELVALLRTQHERGREITVAMLSQTLAGQATERASQAALAEGCARFVRMFRPHAAYEDTELFPALRTITTAAEFEDLAEDFGEEARRRFGNQGFGHALDRVAEIEARLGLADLASYTPAP